MLLYLGLERRYEAVHVGDAVNVEICEVVEVGVYEAVHEVVNEFVSVNDFVFVGEGVAVGDIEYVFDDVVVGVMEEEGVKVNVNVGVVDSVLEEVGVIVLQLNSEVFVGVEECVDVGDNDIVIDGVGV